MQTPTIVQASKQLLAGKKVGHSKWQRIVLLIVLGYEGTGALLGGSLLVTAPDGRFMGMPVDIMHGTFRDFLIPGIILFGLGILNTAAFLAVLRKTRLEGVMAALALGGLAVWFWVEIAILQQVHWLHAMWGLPVIAGGLLSLSLVTSRPIIRKALLVCGILASLLYVAMNIIVPMYYPGYNSFSHTVSELSAIGAPTRLLWNLLGILFIVLEIAFGCGILLTARTSHPLRIAGGLLIAYGLVCSLWPPMHQREVLAAGGKTMTDTMHIVFTAVTGFLMMLAMAFGAAAFGKWFRRYCIATILILLGFGALTGLYAPQLEANLPTPWMGVWERINIYATMLWLIVFTMLLLQREKGTASFTKATPLLNKQKQDWND
jgi:Protein of unknown function (DUF998)